jgi:hypothetical protein
VLVLLLLFSSTGVSAQTEDFYRTIDSLWTLHQYYTLRQMGVVDSHELENRLRKSGSIYVAEAVRGLYKYDPVVKDSLNAKVWDIHQSNMKYMKWTIEHNEVPELDHAQAAIFLGFTQICSLAEFDSIDPLLRKLLKKRIIKSISYANAYDFVQVEHKLPERYFTISWGDPVSRKSCPHTPADISQANIYRKEIGLRKWKPKCTDIPLRP